MNDVNWVDRMALMETASKSFMPTDILVDIGCGIMPQNYIIPTVHICVEPYDEYVEKLQEKISNLYDRSYVIMKLTWAEALKALPQKSVDTVILADVIEHLDKDNALSLLKITEKIARQQILIFTPFGFLPQTHPDGIDAWGMAGGDWQEHKSGWTPEDFGDGWEFVGTKEYYFEDNLKNPFDKPYGAFWAIKKIHTESSEERLSFKGTMNLISLAIAKLNSPIVTRLNIGILQLIINLSAVQSRLRAAPSRLKKKFIR